MKTKTRFNKLTAWLLTLAMLMTFIPGFTLTASAAEIVASQPANGDGTESNPYQICKSEELYWFAQQVNSGNTDICGKLTADITLNENLENKLTITTTGNDFNYGKATLKSGQTVNEWTAIGTEAYTYTGTFDGDGHSVIGLYVNSTDGTSKNNGLFGYVDDATIQNVTVKDSYLAAYSNIGGIVGYIKSGTVENCHYLDSWMYSQNGTMGGIVGYSYASKTATTLIKDCTSNIVFFYYGPAGGIAGSTRWTDIQNCSYTGEMKGSYNNSGGIVGSFVAGTVENCVNNGAVNGDECVGGIVGYSTGNIINCINNGAITTSSNAQYIGGIVGDFYGSSTDLRKITNCTNNGTVTQTGNDNNLSIGVGGIAGQMKDGFITDCTNNAAISGVGQELGGIVGRQATGGNVTIEKCANYGSITGEADFAGGIAGSLTYASLVKDSYNVGAVSSDRYPGGIVGYLQGPYSSTSSDTAVVTGCYSAASVSGTNGGAISGRMNYYATIQNNYYDSTKFTGNVNGYTVGNGQTISGNIGQTTTEFANGKIAYLLNGSSSTDDVVWKQTLSTDTTPSFDGLIVYYDESNNKYYNKLPAAVITFDANGGNCDVESTTTNTMGMIDSLPVPAKDNNNFIGWFDEEDNEITTETIFEENKTIYAKWIVNTYETEWTGYCEIENTIYFYMKDYLPADTVITSMSGSLPPIGTNQNLTYSADVNSSYAKFVTKATDSTISDSYIITVCTSNYGTITITATINLVDFEIKKYEDNKATVIIPTAGTYSLVFADYESGRLNDIDIVPVTVTADTIGEITQASIKGVTIDTGDKIMLWQDMTNLVPLCEAYIVE